MRAASAAAFAHAIESTKQLLDLSISSIELLGTHEMVGHITLP